MENIGCIAILGAGNIGLAAADGILTAGRAKEVVITRRKQDFSREEMRKFTCITDNKEAVRMAQTVIIAPQPKQADELLGEISGSLTEEHVLISVVSGLTIARIEAVLGRKIPIVRAMLNTAISVGQSMTCLAFSETARGCESAVEEIFGSVGKTLSIDESKFAQATVLSGSGIAFALKFVRAFMQACTRHGFHPGHALRIAVQVLKGAAMLIEADWSHPEDQIDKVTTPDGCTIEALAEMEHAGFTSALLRTINVGVEKAKKLYS